jgi:hypothetical protein
MSNGFIKIGETIAIGPENIQNSESVLSDPAIEQRFGKMASSLKRIAPKANEFLYFSATMMHSAEAALINVDGTPKRKANGEIVTAGWDTKNGSWKWVSSDPSVRPYKNKNGDIFPEQELLAAYKQWIGKPLCVDHKSSSVDAIRGIILDTYYDRQYKRVIALCALDKITYPDLANKVALGYSTNVSMGVGVGRAICSDCGTVARTESDFCTHMRSKTSYGEINVDLQPIELSIVVNGADPQAKIRTIIAAANSINNELEAQEVEMNKIVNNATLNSDQMLKLKELEQDLKQVSAKLSDLKDTVVHEEITAPYGQSSGQLNPPTDETDQSVGLNLPARLADSNNNTLIIELNNLRASMEEKLHVMAKNLDTLIKTNNEEIMSNKDATMNKGAYFQGGGGVNEPTPGQKKYEVDPKNEEMRLKGDKQMVGQKPFPEVGDVEGMHPSPESAPEKDELQRKKMLARAEQEARKMRRDSALQQAKANLLKAKEGYFQGGGGVNEPAPKEKKYEVDPKNEEMRLKGDKQMVGQKPFPEVGAVDGMHPSPASAQEKDELSRKKLLQRASLKAKFVRVANIDGTDNLGDSSWQVYAKDSDGEKLVFTASVNEITGGNSDALFDVIATKDFGSKMLEKIRTAGIEKAHLAYKKAQAVAGVGGQVGAADAGGPAEVPAMAPANDVAPEVVDDGGKGDPKDTAVALAEEVRDKASDLSEAVRALTGERAEMDEMGGQLEALPKAASESLSSLNRMRTQLNAGLLSGMKKVIAELGEHAEELDLIATVVESGSSQNDYVKTVVEDAFGDAKKSLADAQELQGAYAKYAHGAANLVKRAKSALEAMEAGDVSAPAMNAEDALSASFEDEAMASDVNAHMPDHDGPGEEDLDLDAYLEELKHEGEEGHELPEIEEEMHMDTNDVMVDMDPKKVPAGMELQVAPKSASIDLTTKEGRSAYRAKLAKDATGKQEDGAAASAESLVGSDSLDAAHSLADGQTKLDTKPSDELGKVETVGEAQKKDLEVARAEPKVRKEAERLNKLISEGAVQVADLDKLISQGLDPEVVKYWKEFWGEAGKEGSEFAKLLTTEKMKAQAAEEMATFRVKIARAYELANEMVRRGLLTDDRQAVTAQVDEIMKWNDDAFSSMTRVVAKHTPASLRKDASIPQMGVIDDNYSPKVEMDFQSELDRAFSNRRY